MDNFITESVWHGLVRKYNGDGMSLKEAYREADLVVNRSMPPIDVLSQSAIVRDRQFGIFMLVRNFPNVIYNLNAMDDWETRARISEGANRYQERGWQIARRLGMVAGLGMGKYLMGRGRNEEEQKNGDTGWFQYGVRTVACEGVYGHLLIHELCDSFAPAVLGEGLKLSQVHVFDVNVKNQIDAVVQDLGKVSRAAQGTGEVDDAVFGALDAAGRVFGYAAALRSLRAGYGLLTDKDFKHPIRTPIGAAGVVFYGDRPDATPASDFDEWMRR
jgi:hypothetical protein